MTFCYFPITFKPPPDDPYGITSDDLKSSLRYNDYYYPPNYLVYLASDIELLTFRKCLASNAQFAKFALPLILEKLSSTSGSAKVSHFILILLMTMLLMT